MPEKYTLLPEKLDNKTDVQVKDFFPGKLNTQLVEEMLKHCDEVAAGRNVLLADDSDMWSQDEQNFIREHESTWEAFDKWRKAQIESHKWKHGNPSTSARDWNEDLFPHKHKCWQAILNFAEHHCKKKLKVLKQSVQKSEEFESAHQQWILDQHKTMADIRETGQSWGIPVNPTDNAWKDENLNLSAAWFTAMLIRAFHHMDGVLLRKVIGAYMNPIETGQNQYEVLKQSIMQQLNLTEGVNPSDAQYFAYFLKFPTLLAQLHTGLKQMGCNVCVLEWCADWEPQLLFWAYPRGPGYVCIRELINEKPDHYTLDRHDLYDLLYARRLEWHQMIVQAWQSSDVVSICANCDSNLHKGISNAMWEICREFVVRVRVWYLTGCPGKRMNPLEI